MRRLARRSPARGPVLTAGQLTTLTVLVILVVITLARVAFAQTGSGYLGGGNLGVDVQVPGGQPSTGGRLGGGTAQNPGGSGGGPQTAPCGRVDLGQAPCESTPGQGAITCGGVAPDRGGAGTVPLPACPTGPNGEPLPPPPPPTAAEARNLVPIPTPAFGIKAADTGITGVETWLWDATASTGRSVSASIRGYTVTATAGPSRWEWTMAAPGQGSDRNPNPVVTATQPGSPEAPAATYTYETSGDYTLTLRVSWGGSFTVDGGPATSLGVSTRQATRAYHVAEVWPTRAAV